MHGISVGLLVVDAPTNPHLIIGKPQQTSPCPSWEKKRSTCYTAEGLESYERIGNGLMAEDGRVAPALSTAWPLVCVCWTSRAHLRAMMLPLMLPLLFLHARSERMHRPTSTAHSYRTGEHCVAMPPTPAVSVWMERWTRNS